MEQTLAPINCDQPLCDMSHVCQLKSVLWQAQRSYLHHLAQFTLADIIDKATIDTIRIMEAQEPIV